MYLFNRFNIWFKGPGEYSPEKAMLLLEKALRFTFGLRTSINRPDDIPGKFTGFVSASLSFLCAVIQIILFKMLYYINIAKNIAQLYK